MGKVIFKDSARIKELTYETMYMLSTLRAASGELGFDIVVTSLNDSKHRVGSYHYRGKASDLRVWNLTQYQCSKLVNYLKSEDKSPLTKLVLLEWRYKYNGEKITDKGNTHADICRYYELEEDKVGHIHWEVK